MFERRLDDPMPPPWHDPTGFAWMVYCRDVLGDQMATREREYLQAAKRALGLLRQPKKVLIAKSERTMGRFMEFSRVLSLQEQSPLAQTARRAGVQGRAGLVWRLCSPVEPSVDLRVCHEEGWRFVWWTLGYAAGEFYDSRGYAAGEFYDSRAKNRREWTLADKVLSSPLDFAEMTNPQNNLFTLCVGFITSVAGAVGKLRLAKSGDILEWVSAGTGTEISVPVDWDEEVAHSGKELWGEWRQRLLRRLTGGSRP